VARFGSFDFDPARRLLLENGREVHLTPKAFDLLALLIDAAPRVVPKSELHDRMWPGGAVSDATLVGLVKEIRRALGDHDESVSLIRTAHRIGYAFAAPLLTDEPAVQVSRWLVAGERLIPLIAGENIVGRDPLSRVSFEDATVSRRHARIISRGSAAALEDLGSKNGTIVNEKALDATFVLRDGDRIRFGDALAVYRESASAPPTVTRASRIGVVLDET
jgi:DNA-binding winged helix-turn-helix (wHTH) protein